MGSLATANSRNVTSVMLHVLGNSLFCSSDFSCIVLQQCCFAKSKHFHGRKFNGVKTRLRFPLFWSITTCLSASKSGDQLILYSPERLYYGYWSSKTVKGSVGLWKFFSVFFCFLDRHFYMQLSRLFSEQSFIKQLEKSWGKSNDNNRINNKNVYFHHLE